MMKAIAPFIHRFMKGVNDMTYGRMPLFPPACAPGNSLQMPLFGGCEPPPPPPQENCKCVRIQNPANPCEYADVELCVDAMGNLSICVRRPPKPCIQPRRKCRKPPTFGCCSCDW